VAEYTRPATWDDVKTLARLLNEAGVEYALVGGYAIAAHMPSIAGHSWQEMRGHIETIDLDGVSFAALCELSGSITPWKRGGTLQSGRQHSGKLVGQELQQQSSRPRQRFAMRVDDLDGGRPGAAEIPLVVGQY
jgi:hypothetical protein